MFRKIKYFAVFFLLILFFQLGTSRSLYAFDSEAFEYMTVQLHSLGRTKDAFDSISTMPAKNKIDWQREDLRKSNSELKGAKDELDKFRGSNNEYIVKSADTFQKIYQLASALNEDKLVLLEKIAKMNVQEVQANLDVLNEYKKSLSQKNDLFLKSLKNAAQLATFTMIDYSRKKDDRNVYRSISREEGEKLLRQLDEIFGDEAKSDPKLLENDFAAAPALIRTFLASDELKASDQY